MSQENRKNLKTLQELPNVGPAMARDLNLLGIRQPDDLKGRDGYELYDELCRLTGRKHDPCVLDLFLSVVDFMNGGKAKRWWEFTEERKRHLAGQ